jgi:putative hydrolase of the HAD superfamily
VIKAVFFDLDGTLLATSASRGVVADLAANVLVRAHPHLNRQALIDRMLSIEPGKPWRRGAGSVVKELGLQGTTAGRAAIAVWNFEGAEHLLTAVEGVLDAISSLNPGVTVGVITNGGEAIQRRNFAPLQLSQRITVFVTSDRAGAFKPDPRIFQFALEEARVEAHEAVYIGDTFETDVVGALGAGMHAVWLNVDGRSAASDVTGYHELRTYANFADLLATLDRA